MINLTPAAEYLTIALHFMACTMLLCGALVWTQRQKNLRQRALLTLTLLLCGAGIMARVLSIYQTGVPSSYQVLPIGELYAGFWEMLILFLYPIETVSPGWLRKRGLWLLFAPIVVISLVLLLVPMEFRELRSFGEVFQFIAEPNVWFRLLILFVFIVPLTVLLLCVPYNWRRSSVDARWVRKYALGMQGIAFFYLCFTLTGSVALRAVHLTYCTLFFIYITYQELYLRLFPDAGKSFEAAGALGCEQVGSTNSDVASAVNAANSTWERLVAYMENDKPWRDPDISLSDIVQKICSNRTTMWMLIKEHGYDNFRDFIAHYRVEAFCQIVNNDRRSNLSDLFFEVGFRSKSAAFSNFKRIKGVTPREYVDSLASPKEC